LVVPVTPIKGGGAAAVAAPVAMANRSPAEINVRTWFNKWFFIEVCIGKKVGNWRFSGRFYQDPSRVATGLTRRNSTLPLRVRSELMRPWMVS